MLGELELYQLNMTNRMALFTIDSKKNCNSQFQSHTKEDPGEGGGGA
jgi:hypothetical protein